MITITYTGYSVHPEYRNTWRESGSHLIGMGFTCDRQEYDDEDNVTAAHYHHKVNTEWTATARTA